MNNVTINIQLDYDGAGMRSARLTGPHVVIEGGYRSVRYLLGLFAERSHPGEDDTPDIELNLRESDLLGIKNAISAMLIASKSE